MDGRTRLLTALANEKPDRLPCQVHSWMQHYLDAFLGGIDQYQAYDRFGMDPVIYTEPYFKWGKQDLRQWRVEEKPLGTDSGGVRHWRRIITTPKGILEERLGTNSMTTWVEEHLIKTEDDYHLWRDYAPVPIGVDWTPVMEARNRIGSRGIVRGTYFHFGQVGPWQAFMMLVGTTEAIYWAMDDPGFVHEVLASILDKTLRAMEAGGKIQFDLVETGGGGGSSTVISPNMHKEFCLPYDQRLHAALHQLGARVVYHLCGGIMPLLETVAKNGANALETMTPPGMGGDCDLAEANRRIGHRMSFIGGFNQVAGFEQGRSGDVAGMVHELHRSCPGGGYICSPSDHFFSGDPANIQAFCDAVRECSY